MRTTTILIALILCSAFVQAQIPVLFINSGSRAGKGNIQELTINNDGSAFYCEHDIKETCKSPTRFTVTGPEIDSIISKATQLGFFSLNNKYETNIADGSGIYVSIRNMAKYQTKSVSVINNNEPTINEFVTWLNNYLSSHKIRIYYAADKLKKS